ncbi:Alpha/Beta hydrolase protein [Aspergillus insuetus]
MSVSATNIATPATAEDGIPRPPFDPSLEAALAIPLLHPDNFSTLEAIRAQRNIFTIPNFLAKFPDLTHKEYTVPAAPDNSRSPVIILSVLTPKTSPSPHSPRPAIYNIHGGGQIAGTRFAGLEFIAAWYRNLDVVIITVEYRLAPEHPAPAALDDSYAGLVWVANHAAELGIDPGRILVQGVSGGGPIAAACAITARDKGYPRLCAQLLSTPMLDCRGDSVSTRQYAEHGPWNGRTNRLAWRCVLGGNSKVASSVEKVSELVSPSLASDLAGVAPAFIDVGGAEVFRDEAVAYASTLWKSGVSAELHVWGGCWHGFDMLAPDVPVSRAATAVKVDWIRRVLGL